MKGRSDDNALTHIRRVIMPPIHPYSYIIYDSVIHPYSFSRMCIILQSLKILLFDFFLSSLWKKYLPEVFRKYFLKSVESRLLIVVTEMFSKPRLRHGCRICPIVGSLVMDIFKELRKIYGSWKKFCHRTYDSKFKNINSVWFLSATIYSFKMI